MPNSEENERKIYTREKLLLVGKSVLSAENKLRVTPSAWENINKLNLCNTKRTKRGCRGGRKKCDSDTEFEYRTYRNRDKDLRCALQNTRSIGNT